MNIRCNLYSEYAICFELLPAQMQQILFVKSDFANRELLDSDQASGFFDEDVAVIIGSYSNVQCIVFFRLLRYQRRQIVACLLSGQLVGHGCN